MNRCPYCGILLIKNKIGDLFCPNCGIVEQNQQPSSDEVPSYLG